MRTVGCSGDDSGAAAEMLNNPIGAGRTGTLMGEYSLRLGEAVLRSRTRDAEQKARLEAEIAARVKSEFIANMSHELRTPLNTVIGFSKLLGEHDRRQLKTTEIVEYANLIQSSADHLLSLINDILDISKIQSGRYTIESSEISVDEVLEAVVAMFRHPAEEVGVQLDLFCTLDNATVRGDPAKLRQALANLVSNAVKFTQRGGRVVIEAVGVADGTRIAIRDTGVGMGEDEIEVALAPFGQVDGGRSRWREGAGLGLPIAKALIGLHGGRLEIESAKSVGTEVVVFLPSPESVTAMERGSIALGGRQ